MDVGPVLVDKVRTWARLERAGLLGRYLPEVAAACRRQRARGRREPWHELATLARLADPRHDPAAADAWAAVAQPDLLLLAGLLHALTRHASPPGAAALARRTAARLGLAPADEQALTLLVGEDGRLDEAAVRVDLHDEEQVLDLAGRLGGPDRARMAYLLAVAGDGQDGDGWTARRREQLDELLRVVLAAMAEPGLTDLAAEALLQRRRAEVARLLATTPRTGERAVRFLAAAPRRYLLAQPAEAIARHVALADPPPGRLELRVAVTPGGAGTPSALGPRPALWRVDVVAHDRPGLLARLVGALSAAGMDIVRAQASTWPDGLVVDAFQVAGAAPGSAHEVRERVERLLARSVAGNLDAGRLLARPPDRPPAAAGPVLVRIDAGASPWHSIVHVEAPDRPGLLYEILLELARHRADVQVARIDGHDGRATDVVYVTDAAGVPLERTAADRLAMALAERLTTPSAVLATLRA